MDKAERIAEARRRAGETSASRAKERALVQKYREDKVRRLSATKARQTKSSTDVGPNSPSLGCAYCGNAHSSAHDVRQCADEHKYQPLSERSEDTTVTSIESVEALLSEATPAYGLLLDAIALSRGKERWDLVERSAAAALAAVTGEVPNTEVYRLMRDIAVARLKGVEYEDLVQALRTLSHQLVEADVELVSSARRVLSDIETNLENLALLLMSDESPSLIKAGSILRRDFERPDLACIAATKAMDRANRPFAALTLRSAAELDQDHPNPALQDIIEAERLRPSFYTANVRARIETARGNIDEAERWGRLANRRDPDGTAGAMIMMKIRSIQGRFGEAHEWAQVAGDSNRPRSDNWLRLEAANELMRGTNKATGVRIVRELSDNGYRPARLRLIEVEASQR